MPKRLRFQAKTNKGLVRNNNEDSYLVQEDSGLCAVCDGLGGHAAGEIASRMAVDTLQQRIQGAKSEPGRQLMAAIEEANRKILSDQQAHPERLGMGTTLSALWFLPDDGEGVIAHIGDSRVYRLREGVLEQLTEDHSPVFRLYKEGSLTKDQLRSHPQKNLIERSLGLASIIKCDLFQTKIEAGDLYLLCTDGLSDCISDSEISKVCQSLPWGSICDHLIQRALDNGGFDNITVILISVEE